VTTLEITTDTDAYAGIADEIVFRLRAAADEIRLLERKTTESMLEIGRQLSAVKAALQESGPEGAWMRWLNAEFGMNDRTARRYIAAHDRFKGRADIMTGLTSTSVIMLAHAPDSVIDDIVAKVADGARVGTAEVNAAVKAAKPTAPKPTTPKPTARTRTTPVFLRTPADDQKACSDIVHGVLTAAGAAKEPPEPVPVLLTLYRLKDGRVIAVSDSDSPMSDAFGVFAELVAPNPKTMASELRKFIKTKPAA